MKSSLTLIVLVLLLLSILAGCAPGLNQSKGMESDTTLSRVFGLGSGMALLRRSCL